LNFNGSAIRTDWTSTSSLQLLDPTGPLNLPTCQSFSLKKVALVINNKNAKTLGLEVPMSILMQIDEVIE
jgi:hypothetical protein